MNSNSPFPKFNAPVSRRSFFGAALASTGVLLASGGSPKLWAAQNAGACGAPGLCDFPVPIPHVTSLPFPSATNPTEAHFFFPGPVEGVDPVTGHDPSVIFNFSGFVGQADLNLTGTGSDLTTGETAAYSFHTDMRFMAGLFVGTDGSQRHGSFAFI